jgi:predicted Abi (CAAX) family protease
LDLNILLRGQSNSLLFADFGGAGEMERQLEQKLGGGVDVHLLYQWGDGSGNNTINSGSAFMAWDTDGKQAGFMRYLNGLPEDVQDNPTITLWMHNEDEMKNNPATSDWVQEVRTDAAMVRDALGQGASTTRTCSPGCPTTTAPARPTSRRACASWPPTAPSTPTSR